MVVASTVMPMHPAPDLLLLLVDSISERALLIFGEGSIGRYSRDGAWMLRPPLKETAIKGGPVHSIRPTADFFERDKFLLKEGLLLFRCPLRWHLEMISESLNTGDKYIRTFSDAQTFLQLSIPTHQGAFFVNLIRGWTVMRAVAQRRANEVHALYSVREGRRKEMRDWW